MLVPRNILTLNEVAPEKLLSLAVALVLVPVK